jgi:hypothetical protein
LVGKKKTYELHDVTYVPYSDGLRQAEMISWGEETLERYVSGVYAELRAKGIRSRAFPDRLLADVIDPDFAKAIVIIEHASDQNLLRDPQGVADTVRVVIGTNQERAYSFSVSSAGARGLVQFIPSTYKLMTRRSDLELITDFVQAMSDPHNAIKAQVALLDSELASMPSSVRALYDVNPGKVNEYLAAAYNGGGGRVRKAIANFGDSWSDSSTAKTAANRAEHDKLINRGEAVKVLIKKADAKTLKSLQAELADIRKRYRALDAQLSVMQAATLRAETVGYVKKLRAIMPLLKPDITTAA